MRLQYVITGTGHCGTTWLQQYLDAGGIPTAWEYAFRNKFYPERCNHRMVEVSGMAAAWLDHPDFPRDVRVIHMVRNTLRVWRSIRYTDNVVPGAYRDRGWTEGVLGQKLPDALEEFVTAFIYLWNKRVEDSGKVWQRVRLEEAETRYREIFDFKPIRGNANLFRRPHARKDAPPVTWKDIPDCEWKPLLREQAKKYGYADE